jgi:serine/threonine protein kinase
VQVAIKTVLFQASGDIHSDPVLREAMLALRIAHPNLVATYRANVRMLEDAGLQNAGSPGNIQFRGDITPSYQLFLLQEYCDSGTLYDWLSRERMHPGNIPDKVRNSKKRLQETCTWERGKVGTWDRLCLRCAHAGSL